MINLYFYKINHQRRITDIIRVGTICYTAQDNILRLITIHTSHLVTFMWIK